MSRAIVVNEQDEEIGLKERDDITLDDIYRVTALWLTNSEGQVLMALRAFSKKKDPGVWGPAVAGTVEEGETYDGNIIKEIEEELGLVVTRADIADGPHLRITTPRSNYFSKWYVLTRDLALEDLHIEEKEVAKIAWFAPDSLRQEIAEHPEHFTPAAAQWITHFI